MKQLLAGILIACSFPALADTSTCDVISTLAHSVMSGRQNGVAMKDSMKIANESSGDAAFREFMKNLVIAAYDSPAYSTEQMKKKAITDFEDQFYLVCAKAQR